ncbi:4Fe-4S dicluster domain-containing protein [bacterium]|nr:4Fe-4S dicluster domain-containing protein [candidate division CSSED10-310 bacterium]
MNNGTPNNKSTDTNSLLKYIESCGVVGAGGAGFPTHVKLNCSADIVIANGAECEPLLHKDKELLIHEAEVVIRGLLKVVEITGAERGIIGIKRKAKPAIDAVTSLLRPPLTLHLLEDSYPAGDECILTYEITKRITPPGGLPIHVGVVTQNVETLWWLGTEKPVTQKWITVAGNIPEPATYKVPIGTEIKEVLQLSGWTPNMNSHVLSGGVMMGQLVRDVTKPITKTMGGLIVLPADHPLMRRYKRDERTTDRIARSSCDQCNFCTQLCPRYLLGHPVQPHLAMRHIGMASDQSNPPTGSMYCCGCMLCTFWSCPEDLDPGIITFRYRQQLMENKVTTPVSDPQIHPMYEYRKTPTKALKRRLGLDSFIDNAPLSPKMVISKKVYLPLKQHIGSECVPCVSIGDSVNPGDIVAKVPEGKLGAPVHASISGRIISNGDPIVIEGVDK